MSRANKLCFFNYEARLFWCFCFIAKSSAPCMLKPIKVKKNSGDALLMLRKISVEYDLFY